MYTRTFLVHFSDCDPQGIVFFARYFDWAHETLEEWTASQEGGWPRWFRNSEVAIPLVRAESDYRNPTRAGDRVTAKLVAEKVGDTSLTLLTEFSRQEATGPTVCARVRTVHVFVDQKTFKPVRIPDEFRKMLG